MISVDLAGDQVDLSQLHSEMLPRSLLVKEPAGEEQAYAECSDR